MNAPESTSPSMVISPNSNGKYNILRRFLSTVVECRGIYVSPSFSAMYSLIEKGKLGKSSGIIDSFWSRKYLPWAIVTMIVRHGRLYLDLLIIYWVVLWEGESAGYGGLCCACDHICNLYQTHRFSLGLVVEMVILLWRLLVVSTSLPLVFHCILLSFHYYIWWGIFYRISPRVYCFPEAQARRTQFFEFSSVLVVVGWKKGLEFGSYFLFQSGSQAL